MFSRSFGGEIPLAILFPSAALSLSPCVHSASIVGAEERTPLRSSPILRLQAPLTPQHALQKQISALSSHSPPHADLKLKIWSFNQAIRLASKMSSWYLIEINISIAFAHALLFETTPPPMCEPACYDTTNLINKSAQSSPNRPIWCLLTEQLQNCFFPPFKCVVRCCLFKAVHLQT